MKVFFLEMRYSHLKFPNKWLQNELFGTNVFLSLDDAQRYVENKAKRVFDPSSYYEEVIDFTAIIYNAKITSEGIVSNEIISVKKYNGNDFNQ